VKVRTTAAFLDILIHRRIWNWHAIDYSTMQYAMFVVAMFVVTIFAARPSRSWSPPAQAAICCCPRASTQAPIISSKKRGWCSQLRPEALGKWRRSDDA
jgi:hypothetical protein